MPPTLAPTTNPTEIQNLVDTTRPEHYFSTVFRYAPMGVKSKAMMTLLASRASKMRTDDPLFHFYQKAWNQRDCAAIDVYLGPGLTNAVSTTVAAGTPINIALTASNAKLWQVGMHVVLTKFADAAYKQVSAETKGRVEGVTIGSDTTSYITVKLSAEDTSGAASAGTYLRINPAGQSHPNIHTLPESHLEQVQKYDGACSTFLGSYSMDDITRNTKLRVDYNLFTEAKMDGMRDFAIDKEMAFLEGVLDVNTPNHLKTGGLAYYLGQHGVAGQNIVDALTDTTYLTSGTTGAVETWIYELLEGLMEYRAHWADTEEIPAFCGGQALVAINRMIRDKGQWNIGQSSGTDEFGFSFTKLQFQHGSIKFYQHPLFTNAARYAGTIVMPTFENIEQVTFMPFEEIPADVANAERAKRAMRDGTTWSSVAKGGFREVTGWKFNALDSMFIVKNVHPALSR